MLQWFGSTRLGKFFNGASLITTKSPIMEMTLDQHTWEDQQLMDGLLRRIPDSLGKTLPALSRRPEVHHHAGPA